MPLSDASHLSRSPSLTSSIDSSKSSSLPSPKGNDLVIGPPQFNSKSPSNHGRFKQPTTRRMTTSDTLTQPRYISASPLSPASNNLPNKRDTLSESHSPHSPLRRYHPYVPRERGFIPPALHYAARSLGIMSPTDITLEEIGEVCCTVASANRLSHTQIEEKWFH